MHDITIEYNSLQHISFWNTISTTSITTSASASQPGRYDELTLWNVSSLTSRYSPTSLLININEHFGVTTSWKEKWEPYFESQLSFQRFLKSHRKISLMPLRKRWFSFRWFRKIRWEISQKKSHRNRFRKHPIEYFRFDVIDIEPKASQTQGLHRK